MTEVAQQRSITASAIVSVPNHSIQMARYLNSQFDWLHCAAHAIITCGAQQAYHTNRANTTMPI